MTSVQSWMVEKMLGSRMSRSARHHDSEEFRQAGFARIAFDPLENLFSSICRYAQKVGKEFEEAENPWDGIGRVGGKVERKLKTMFEEQRKQKKSSIDVKVYPWTPLQGETVAILVSLPSKWGFLGRILSVFNTALLSEDPSTFRVCFGGVEFPSFPSTDNRIWRTLIPTTPLDEPGPAPLSVEVNDGSYEKFDGVVELGRKEYPVESIWLSESKSKRFETEREKTALKALTSTASPVQQWSGPLLLPSEGRKTTEYGIQRYYNGKFANGYYHRGVDYGAREGSPVRAPSTGRVLLVGKEADGFEICGNCVGLDHGHGVTSILMHLSSTCVKEGDIVERGQVVGLVGQTGLATGPHLHWGLYVHGEAVDPHFFMNKQPWL